LNKLLIYYILLPSYSTPFILLYRTVLCPQWGPRTVAARADRYYSMLDRTILKMLVYRMPPPPISTQLTVYVYTYMYRRTCANARVVSHVSRTCTAVYIFTGNEY
jgi:hypothetical protein